VSPYNLACLSILFFFRVAKDADDGDERFNKLSTIHGVKTSSGYNSSDAGLAA
jgi:hypothetical protein